MGRSSGAQAPPEAGHGDLRGGDRRSPLLMPAKEPTTFRPSEAAISRSMGAKGSRAKAADLVGDANRLSGRLCSVLWSLSAFGLTSPVDSSLQESSGVGERERRVPTREVGDVRCRG
jgi:hypothetical protein